jgi:Homing endonuclease associated repeat
VRTTIIGGQEFVIDPYKEPLVQLKGAIKGYMRGTLPYAASDGKLPCALCDPLRTFEQLSHHLKIAHRLTPVEYRDALGLLRTSSLTSVPYQERKRQSMPPEQMERIKALGGAHRGHSNPYAAKAKAGQQGMGDRAEHLNKKGVCRDQLIAVAKIAARKNNGVLTGADLMVQGINPDKVLRRFFPSIHALAEAAGATAFRRGWTDAELLTAFRDLAQKLGRTPIEDDLGPANGTPVADVYRRRFGSKVEICRLTGVRPYFAAPLAFGDSIDILNRYALGLGVVDLSRVLHRAHSEIADVLTKYGVPYGQMPESQRREARAFAATMARRLAGLPDEEEETA